MNRLEEGLTEIVRNVWSLIPRLDVRTLDRAPSGLGRRLCARVQIRGAWAGTVEMACPEPLARRAAARMFSVAPDQVSSADVHDALGELVNVAAGNFKSLLAPTCTLSTPEVKEEDPGEGPVLIEISFACGESPFVVAVRGDQAPAPRALAGGGTA